MLIICGTSIDNSFDVLDFFFFIVFLCFSMCQSVCVSVHLFIIHLKFLKTCKYWIAQLVYVSLVSGLELKKCRLNIKMGDFFLLFLLKLLIITFLFYLVIAATRSPLGWHTPHVVDNKDTQYLGDQHWQQCWCFRIFFFFVSTCLFMCQSVCVSVHLFTSNLKFLSLALGLEFKKMQTAYQNDGILIVILIEILNDYYMFCCMLTGNNVPFRVTPSTCCG